MSPPPDPFEADDTSTEAPPPLGSWARLYLLVAAVAVVLIALLWWFSATWNVPLEGR